MAGNNPDTAPVHVAELSSCKRATSGQVYSLACVPVNQYQTQRGCKVPVQTALCKCKKTLQGQLDGLDLHYPAYKQNEEDQVRPLSQAQGCTMLGLPCLVLNQPRSSSSDVR